MTAEAPFGSRAVAVADWLTLGVAGACAVAGRAGGLVGRAAGAAWRGAGRAACASPPHRKRGEGLRMPATAEKAFK
ncbi:hypothetical protein BOSE125_30511 [Bosea sp. 125]|nr:hypothetical protein BOSE125_30511 [Bosea sp. 125]